MKVTIGIVNYNRLFYLRSLVKSLIYSLGGMDVDLICVDDNSKESGTAEYLEYLEDIGFRVFRKVEGVTSSNYKGPNDAVHNYPFCDSLNIIYKESDGEFIVTLAEDLQFIRKGWLQESINLFEHTDSVNSVFFDAQRKLRLNRYKFKKVTFQGIDYFLDMSRHYVGGTGVQVWTKEFLDKVGGWDISSVNPENTFVNKAKSIFGDSICRYSLKIPACIGIYTDPIGTNARVRDGKRFGKYWAAKNDLYYDYIDVSDYIDALNSRPYSIEEVAKASWKLPIDSNGDWRKQNININTCNDYELVE